MSENTTTEQIDDLMKRYTDEYEERDDLERKIRNNFEPIFKRSLLKIEVEYLKKEIENLEILVQTLKSTLVESNTLQFAMFNFVFIIPSQMAETMLNTKNHINTFMVRISFEENEWRVIVTIKSVRSQGKPLHTQYHGQTNNGEVPKLIDVNIIGSLQLIDPSWATNMLICLPGSNNEIEIFSVPKGLICGR